MDLTSNAQSLDGAEPEARMASTGLPDRTDSSSASTAHEPEDPIACQGKSGLNATPGSAKFAPTTAMNDLTTPPPAYKVKQREHFYQFWRMKHVPKPPDSLDDAPIIPLAHVSFLNEFLYIWISPLMRLGAARPLQVTDLWAMDESRQAATQAGKLRAAYAKRQRKANDHNTRLDAGEVGPRWYTRIAWSIKRGKSDEKLQRWRELHRKKASLAWSLNETAGWPFWLGGVSKVVGDMAQLFGPLVSRNLIEFAQEKARDRLAGVPGPHIGRGIGDAIGLMILTIMASVFQHFFFYRSMSTGVMLRAALSTVVFEKSLVLSQQARVTMPTGKLMAHLSTDISRIDYATQWIHAVWTAPIQIAVCTVLLIIQLGWPSLVGIGLFVLLVPVQSKIMGYSVTVRKKSMVWTDARSRTLQELLSSFAILKYFVFERAYLKRIADIRGKELVGIRKISLIKAANQALALSLPVLAAVTSIVVYIGTGNELNPAKIFTAISLFTVLRQPLMFLPRALSAAADAVNAIQRLEDVFEAETRGETKNVDLNLPVAIRCLNASFAWLTAAPDQVAASKKGKHAKSKHGGAKEKSAETPQPQRDPFKITNLSIEIPRGKLVAIVGSVGCGKSSLLSGLIGEMKCLGGEVTFGGTVAYCAQTAFIQNATLRDNVLFGQPWDEDKYWQVLRDASLISDCLQLPDGDLTEIGERGINISGGQRQRINVARALYYNAPILIIDDALSALDAHVGNAVFENAMLKSARDGRSVLLVTHALHVLPQVDYIYTVADGHIVEEGTYAELSCAKGAFSSLMEEYGGAQTEKDEESADKEEVALASETHDAERKAYEKSQSKLAAGTGRLEGRLLQQEKRNTGNIKKEVYKQYIRAGRGWVTIPLVLASAVLMQGAQSLAGLWIVFWQDDAFKQPIGFYMGMYAGIGCLQAIATFAMGAAISLFTYFASATLHGQSIQRIFFAPSSWFASVPVGRILNVFGKDVDVLDSLLADSLRMTTMILGNVASSVVVVSIYFPWFLIAVGVIIFGYLYFWSYYRASSREIKRLDSMLRSLLYGHFSESLSGLATIRAYDENERFKRENTNFIDLEDRAYMLTSVNQRWLAIRVDSLGSLMVLVVGLMSAIGVSGISPTEVGLVLTFCIGLTQAFGMVTRQMAETENNMNAVERLAYYSGADLPQEASHEIVETTPSPTWPERGEIMLESVTMAYRPDLPPVLKNITAHIGASEKVGLIGRTGAGKSSMTNAIFRMVELSSGQIVIDGIDISTLGLAALRSKIAIIPQDPQLFSGTMRTNLDPFNQYDDARLNDALKRAYLIGDEEDSSHEKGSPNQNSRFFLDTEIEDGGENLSHGQRSLLSLARALVKDSQIVVMDEATASVDLDTDSKIQETIVREFAHKTLLCIAHRLRTVIGYDRIMVLEQGEIMEFDTPLELFRRDGMFANMCHASSITEADIVKAQSQKLR